MGEIEPVIGQGRMALRQENATLKSVAAAMLADAPYDPAEDLKPAESVTLSTKLLMALKDLPVFFGRHQVTQIRQLTEIELRDLGAEQQVIDQIMKPLEARREAIKETVRHHMDLTAVADGKVGPHTERDANGHYVVARKDDPERVPVPGSNKAWSREYRSGRVEIDGRKLLDLYDDGEITREQYLAMTREVRVFDEEKALRSMSKDPSLLNVFRKIIKRGRPGTSLYMRNQK